MFCPRFEWPLKTGFTVFCHLHLGLYPLHFASLSLLSAFVPAEPWLPSQPSPAPSSPVSVFSLVHCNIHGGKF